MYTKMNKILLMLSCLLTLFSCSKNEDEEFITKDSKNVELIDLKGEWCFLNSNNLNGVKLVLDDTYSCTWSDKFDNEFVGPYYMLEDIDDNVLKEQCNLISSDVNDRIHISKIKIKHNGLNGNCHLWMECDLKPFLPCKNWVYFKERVDREAWYFWEDNYWVYEFQITNYSINEMKLELFESYVRFGDYTKKYPLRMDKGSTVTLQRIK